MLLRILSSAVIVYLSQMSRKSSKKAIVFTQRDLPQLLEVGRKVRVRGQIAVTIDIHLAVCLEVMLGLK
jgi:hypothetical protein